MKYKIILSFVFLLLLLKAFSQEPTGKLRSAIENANQLMNASPLEARKSLLGLYSESAEKDAPDDWAELYFTLGKTYYFEQRLDSALFFFNKSLQLSKSNPQLEAESFFNIGRSYFYQSDYVRALANFVSAIKAYELMGDKKGQAKTNNAMGIVSSIMGEEQRALGYMQKALALNEAEADSAGMAGTLDNMGNVYARMGDLNTSLTYGLKSLKIKEAVGDKRALAISYENLGDTYNELGDLDNSMSYYLKSLSLVREEGSDYYLAYTFLNMAKIFLSKKEWKNTLAYTDSALSISLKHNQIDNIHIAYDILHEVSLNQGNYAKALQYYKQSMAYKDSLLNLNKQKIIEELKTTYETEKKEQTIQQLEQEKEITELQAAQERQLRYIIILVAIVILLGAGFIYYRYRIKERTARLLDQKNNELQSLNNTKDRLFAIISHDLKSPLSAFNTVTSSLTDNIDKLEKGQIKQYLQSLKDSSRSLYDMMNNLLHWALTQTGQVAYKPMRLNVGVMLTDIVQQLRLAIESKELNIVYEFDEDLEMESDVNMLTIIFRNLIANAIKFSYNGKSIKISASKVAGRMIVMVEDQGIGLSSEDQTKLFMFESDIQQIGNSKEKGTGIGLRLCKELVDKLNGLIEVYSQPGMGTKFTVTFPH